MAKISAPAYSISAAGTLGAAIVWRRTRHGQVAQCPPRYHATASPTQASRRAIWRDAAAAWRTTDATTRAAWSTAATTQGPTGYMLWLHHWHAQRATAATPPRLP